MTSKATASGALVRTGLAPRGLSRIEAAAYIGVSASLFDIMVADGRMPAPKRIGSRTVWDRAAVDAAFESLPDTAGNTAEPDDVWSRVSA